MKRNLFSKIIPFSHSLSLSLVRVCKVEALLAKIEQNIWNYRLSLSEKRYNYKHKTKPVLDSVIES
jgi:hypothetical protein